MMSTFDVWLQALHIPDLVNYIFQFLSCGIGGPTLKSWLNVVPPRPWCETTVSHHGVKESFSLCKIGL